MAYSEKVIDHYSNPKNVGTLDKSKKNVGTGLVGAPECGDVMRLQIEVDERDEKIGRKIRNAETQKIPIMLIVGEKEMELNQVSLRVHGEGDKGAILISDFMEDFKKELKIV